MGFALLDPVPGELALVADEQGTPRRPHCMTSAFGRGVAWSDFGGSGSDLTSCTGDQVGWTQGVEVQ